MKKTNFLVLVASIVTLGFFSTSCKKDGAAPVITLATSSIQDKDTVAVGDSVTIEFSVDAENKISKVEITNSKAAVLKTFTDVSVSKFSYTFAAEAVGVETYNINVKDKKDLSTTSSLVITTVSGVKSYTTKLVYAPTANKSSKTFFSASSGSTYDVTGFSTSSTSIDFGYFYGANAKASFASPSDYLSTAYDIAALYPSATRNVTTFAVSTQNFDGIATTVDIKAAYTGGTLATNGVNPQGGATRLYDVTAGKVVAFKTASGIYGVLKVVAIVDADNDGLFTGDGDYITIDVKVQE